MFVSRALSWGVLGAFLAIVSAESVQACITGDDYRVKEWRKSSSNRGGYDLIFSVVDRETKTEREIYVPQDGGRVVALLALQSGRDDFTEKAGKITGNAHPQSTQSAFDTYCGDKRVQALRISVSSVSILRDAVKEMNRAIFENRVTLHAAIAGVGEEASGSVRTRLMRYLGDLTKRVEKANEKISREKLDTISGETYCAIASALTSPVMTVPTDAELAAGKPVKQYGMEYAFGEVPKGSKLKDLRPEQATEKFLVQPYPYQASAVAKQFAGTNRFAAYPILANEITGYTAPKPRGGCSSSVHESLPDGASGAKPRSGSGSTSSDVK